MFFSSRCKLESQGKTISANQTMNQLRLDSIRIIYCQWYSVSLLYSPSGI